MREARREQDQLFCNCFKPPRLGVVQVPVLGRQADLLVAVLVEIDLVRFFVGLDVQHTRDKRVWMSVFVMPLSGLGVVQPRLRDPKVYVLARGMDLLQVRRNRCLTKIAQALQLNVVEDVVIVACRVAFVVVLALFQHKLQLPLRELTVEIEPGNRCGKYPVQNHAAACSICLA